MKSDHRRELHANELERLTENIGRFFEKYGMQVLIGLVAAVLIGIGIYWFVTTYYGGDTQGTLELVNATTADDFQNIADNPDRADWKARPLALLSAAQRRLRDGNRYYFTGRKAGRKELKAAEANIRKVLEVPDLSLADRERALYLHATAIESLCDSDTTPAVAAYQKLLSEFPKSLYKEVAEERIKRLKDPLTEQFYAFLAGDDRRPADRKMPQDDIHKGVKQKPAEQPVTLPRNVPFLLKTHLDDPAPPFPTKKPRDGKGPKTSGPELRPPKTTPGNKNPRKASKPK
ncbi:MAG: tol-pal system YbgF family protein [Planctomycetaceae bacterium]